LFLRQTKLLDQSLIGSSAFEGVEVCPLKVFDKGEFKRFTVRQRTNYCRDLGKSCGLCRPPPTLAGHDLIPAPDGTDDNRL